MQPYDDVSKFSDLFADFLTAMAADDIAEVGALARRLAAIIAQNPDVSLALDRTALARITGYVARSVDREVAMATN
jgi:hypothetical protein